MNVDYRFNVQTGKVLVRLDRAILGTGLGVPHRQEVMFVPSNAHAGAQQGATE